MNNEQKKLILGIDTGGTFTDGVIIDAKSNKLLSKVKVETIKKDLSISIRNCIEKLNVFDRKNEITAIGLSTTLATNSVVEGKKNAVGLITMHNEIGLKPFRVECEYRVKGEINVKGDVIEKINEQEIINIIDQIKDKVDSLVVSGIFSIRNPEHEKKIKEIAWKKLGIPIICAHELSSELGFIERTETAILNAHLLPIIDDLIKKTKKTMKQFGIEAELYVVKGDGTMMQEKEALERPVETVLSGPAASVLGGSFLCHEKNAIFVDIGGTTTDIAYMHNGKVSLTKSGAKIGGWNTKVMAADVYTTGLGGDSRLTVGEGQYSFGPMKALPISIAGRTFPYLANEIKNGSINEDPLISGFHYGEALILNNINVNEAYLSDTEKTIIKAIEERPHSITYLAKSLTKAERLIGISNLLKRNIVTVVSVTPTDVLHAAGEFIEGCAYSARVAIDASMKNLKVEEPKEALKRKFLSQLAFEILKSGMYFDGTYNSEIIENSWFYDRLFSERKTTGLMCNLQKNIVAMGAPAEAWISKLNEELNTTISIPENFEVANAIGTTKGTIRKNLTVLIRLDYIKGEYNIFFPWKKATEKTMEDAKTHAYKDIDLWINKLKKELNVLDLKKDIHETVTSFLDDKDGTNISELKLDIEIYTVPECFKA